MKFSPSHVGLSTSMVLCKQTHCWKFMSVASLLCLEDTNLQQAFRSSGSYNLSVPLRDVL